MYENLNGNIKSATFSYFFQGENKEAYLINLLIFSKINTSKPDFSTNIYVIFWNLEVKFSVVRCSLFSYYYGYTVKFTHNELVY